MEQSAGTVHRQALTVQPLERGYKNYYNIIGEDFHDESAYL